MNEDVAKAQADTLTTWAEEWARDGGPGSSEVSFLLSRASRLMRGAGKEPDPLPEAPVQSELAGDLPA